MMTHDNGSQERWHFDRTVNVAVVIGFLGMIGSGAWFAASVTGRVDNLEKAQLAAAPLSERIIRLETKLDSVVDRIAEIKGLISAPKEPIRR